MDDMRAPDITYDSLRQLLMIRIHGSYTELGMRRALLHALSDERLVYVSRLLWDMRGTNVDFGAAGVRTLVQLASTVADQPQMQRVAIVTDSLVMFNLARLAQSLLSWTRADVERAVFATPRDALAWLCAASGEEQSSAPP
jgi:hypothetical protein